MALPENTKSSIFTFHDLSRLYARKLEIEGTLSPYFFVPLLQFIFMIIKWASLSILCGLNQIQYSRNLETVFLKKTSPRLLLQLSWDHYLKSPFSFPENSQQKDSTLADSGSYLPICYGALNFLLIHLSVSYKETLSNKCQKKKEVRI